MIQRSLFAQLKESQDGELPGVVDSSNQLKCGACGLPGHMRTNRTCPYFRESSPTSPSNDDESPIDEEGSPGNTLFIFLFFDINFW